MKRAVIEWLGWYGVVATILAYALLSFGALSGTSLWYQGLNFTGAVGVTIETWVRRDYQPFWLNLVWAAIALIAIANILLHLSV
ncbi:MAG: CBU_0592 family membrane protein [Bacillota bacterium]